MIVKKGTFQDKILKANKVIYTNDYLYKLYCDTYNNTNINQYYVYINRLKGSGILTPLQNGVFFSEETNKFKYLLNNYYNVHHILINNYLYIRCKPSYITGFDILFAEQVITVKPIDKHHVVSDFNKHINFRINKKNTNYSFLITTGTLPNNLSKGIKTKEVDELFLLYANKERALIDYLIFKKRTRSVLDVTINYDDIDADMLDYKRLQNYLKELIASQKMRKIIKKEIDNIFAIKNNNFSIHCGNFGP